MNDREQWVQQRAYAIWETEGRPDGRDRAHWEQAEHELTTAAATAPRASGSDPAAEPVVESKGKARPRPAAKPAAATASSRRKKSPELRP